jgi:tight adherence protein C
VEAGLAFDGALAKVAEKMKGALVDELTRMLQETRVGVSRSTALKNLSERCGVQDVSLFTAALIQADQLGVSIANILNIQSDNVRTKRKQRVREAAMKAPIKLLFPLVMFIFPTLFIVLLGPAMISIMRNLFK